MMTVEHVGKIIKKRRKELKWTLVKLSRLSYVSVGHLNNVECGFRGLRDNTQESIFKALGLISGGIRHESNTERS